MPYLRSSGNALPRRPVAASGQSPLIRRDGVDGDVDAGENALGLPNTRGFFIQVFVFFLLLLTNRNRTRALLAMHCRVA